MYVSRLRGLLECTAISQPTNWERNPSKTPFAATVAEDSVLTAEPGVVGLDGVSFHRAMLEMLPGASAHDLFQTGQYKYYWLR